MINASDIKRGLLSLNLDTGLEAKISDIATVLAELGNGTLPPNKVADILMNPAFIPLLKALIGQKIHTGNRVLSFGSTGGQGTSSDGHAVTGGRNITIGGDATNCNISTGDINFKISIKNYMPPEVASEEAKSSSDLLSQIPTDTIPESTTFQPFSDMVYSQNKTFVGRKNELRMLAEMFKKNSHGQPATVAITGMPGVGKTQLAAEFLHRYGQYFKGGAFCFNFANPENITEQVARCGSPGLLNLPDFDPEADTDDQAQIVQKRWRSPIHCLLIFDNCEDEGLLRKWRPKTGGAHVLITSQRGEWAIDLGVEQLKLDKFAREESIELLKKFRKYSSSDDFALNEIAIEVGDLPMALYLAGIHLLNCKIKDDGEIYTPSEYLDELRGPAILRHKSLQGSEPSPTNRSESVNRVIEMSYVHLDCTKEDDARAILLLQTISHFAAGEFIPRRLLALMRDKTRKKNSFGIGYAVKRLVEHGLVFEDEEGGAVRVHQLIADFVRGVASEALAAKAKEDAKNAIFDVLFFPESSGYAESLPIKAHIRAVISELFEEHFQKGDYEEAAALQIMISRFMQRWGNYKELIANIVRVVDKIEDSKSKIHILHGLGTAYGSIGDFQNQFRCYNQALDVACKLGLKPEEASVLGSLGNYYIAKDDSKMAISYLEQAINILSLSSENDKNLKAKFFLSLGFCYHNLGYTEQAIEYNEQAQSLSKSLYDLSVRQEIELTYIINRGHYYHFHGQNRQAIDFYNQAIERVRKTGDVRLEASLLGNLGEYYRALWETTQAHDTFSKALEISKSYHLNQKQGEVLHSLAELLVDEGNYDRAIEFAREGADIGLSIGKPSLISANNKAIARACLFADQPVAAHTSALVALENTALLDKPYAFLLLGLAQLQHQNNLKATESFKSSYNHAVELTGADPKNYQALDVQCLALMGLNISGQSENKAEAIRCYKEARAINNDSGVVKRIAGLLKILAQADTRQTLKEWLDEINKALDSDQNMMA